MTNKMLTHSLHAMIIVILAVLSVVIGQPNEVHEAVRSTDDERYTLIERESNITRYDGRCQCVYKPPTYT